MTQPPFMTLSDYVDELTRPHTHREHYTAKVGHTTYGLDHVTKVPALVHQLRYATPTGKGEELGGGGYESRPAASLESLDTLTDIDLEAARWVRDLGEDDPGDRRDPKTGRYIQGSGTIACLQLLNGLAANLERCKKPGRGCCTWHDLERDVRRWWARARIVTGWDSAAWRPDNSCPVCGVRGGLRVKLVEQVATCTECRETWEHSNIGLLAEHIRNESAGVRLAPTAVFCWCAWPRPPADAWPSLCPSCASPWCHRAGWAQALVGPDDTPEHAWVS